MNSVEPDANRGFYRWAVTCSLSLAIAISYLDRQTLPWVLPAVQADIPFNNQVKAALDSAFLITYGLMYVGGGLLLDRLGTRRGLIVIMGFWSIACASHGVADGVLALAASRLLLGAGEGGGFPAVTRAVTEWFSPRHRGTAMGVINGGTAIGGVLAPPIISWGLTHAVWFGIAPWRWIFFLTGGIGIAWVLLWTLFYRPPAVPGLQLSTDHGEKVRFWQLLTKREVWALVIAKFLSDGAWYFYLFWLPKYLFDVFHVDIKAAGSVGWIPYAVSGIGAVFCGGLSSFLLRAGVSLDRSRKVALAVSAGFMPWVILAPHSQSLAIVIFLFSLAFFGQQAWSTLIMVLPTDLIPKSSVGTLAGLVGLGGALGGVVLGQIAGWLRDQGASYEPVLLITGSLHLMAFVIICLFIPKISLLTFKGRP